MRAVLDTVDWLKSIRRMTSIVRIESLTLIVSKVVKSLQI